MFDLRRLETSAEETIVHWTLDLLFDALLAQKPAVELENLDGWLQGFIDSTAHRAPKVRRGSEHEAAVRRMSNDAAATVTSEFMRDHEVNLAAHLVKISECIAARIITYGIDSGSTLAMTGFGAADMLPMCAEFELYGWCAGDLLAGELTTSGGVSLLSEAHISTLAQDREMSQFLTGVPPWIYDVSHRAICSATGNFLNSDPAGIGAIDGEILTRQISDEVERSVRRFSEMNYIRPMLATVRGMEVDELASVAESLVALECLRKLVAGEPATVGGAIDVAVVTRHEGFQWVRKKPSFSET